MIIWDKETLSALKDLLYTRPRAWIRWQDTELAILRACPSAQLFEVMDRLMDRLDSMESL